MNRLPSRRTRIPSEQRPDLTRRRFLLTAFWGWVATPFLWQQTACLPHKPKTREEDQSPAEPCTSQQPCLPKRETVYAVYETLWPPSPSIPSVDEIGVVQHFFWTVQDEWFDPDIRQWLLTGFQKLPASFSKWNLALRTQTIQQIAQTEEGHRWLVHLTTLLLEALLAHPIYGVNKQQCGWKWLDIYQGIPPPDEQTRYPDLFNHLDLSSPANQKQTLHNAVTSAPTSTSSAPPLTQAYASNGTMSAPRWH